MSVPSDRRKISLASVGGAATLPAHAAMHSFRFCRLSLLPLVGYGCLAVGSASAQSPKKHPSPVPKALASPADASPSLSGTPYVLPDVVAKVDGIPIGKDELTRVTQTLLQGNGRSLKNLSPADQRRAFQSVLDDVIVDKILVHQSADEKVSDLDVEAQYGALRGQYPTPAAFDAELKRTGQTSDQVKQNIHLQLAQKQWIEQQIVDQVKVTPEEVEKFYKEGPPERFDAPEMVKASQILVAVKKDVPPEEALAAEKKITALAERIKKGESYESVGKNAAADPAAGVTTGDMNYFTRDRIMPEFADAAFALKVGEVSAPVRTQLGYHLIKVTDHKAAHHADFNEAKDQISAYLQSEKRQAAVAALVKSLRADAQVEIFLS